MSEHLSGDVVHVPQVGGVGVVESGHLDGLPIDLTGIHLGIRDTGVVKSHLSAFDSRAQAGHS